MKITKAQLKQIIKEELSSVLSEESNWRPKYDAGVKGIAAAKAARKEKGLDDPEILDDEGATDLQSLENNIAQQAGFENYVEMDKFVKKIRRQFGLGKRA